MREISLALICALAAWRAQPPILQARAWQEPELLASIASGEIKESSGVASSTTRPSIYYTHNDSGDVPRFFKFDTDGRVLATYILRGAEAIDWEDMASARIDGRSYLFLGDIGDNQKRRSTITIYRVEEPHGAAGVIANFETYTLTYPDGPHDAETLMANPKTGDLYIVAKTGERPGVYKLARPPRSGRFKLRRIGAITIPSAAPGGQLVTGGDISPDGKWVVVRTYFAAYEWPVPKKFDDWVKGSPSAIRLAGEMQGEAICYSRNGEALITTSEGTPCPVSIVRRLRH